MTRNMLTIIFLGEQQKFPISSHPQIQDILKLAMSVTTQVPGLVVMHWFDQHSYR